jgi:hypothetical protein
VIDALAEASSARALLLMERGARGTGRGTYSTYWTGSLQEAPGRTVNTRDLLAEVAMARLAPASSLAGLSLVEIGSTKLHPISTRRPKEKE